MIALGDYEGILLQEFLEVSFLTLMDEVEQHTEQNIMYGGNVYSMHACVEQINPNQPVASLRKMV